MELVYYLSDNMRIFIHIRNLISTFIFKRKEKDPHEENWGIGSQ